MGFIAQLAKGKKAFPGQNQGKLTWDEVFGTMGKERPKPRSQASNSWTRSSISNPEAFKRLLVAMRSMAPGGWSDDRYEQTLRHYTGAVYTAVNSLAKQMGQAEYQVFEKDENHQDGKRQVSADHPLVKLLGRPNKQDSFGKWMQRVTQQLKLTGTALTWMVPNAEGRPCELYCIPTAIAVPQSVANAEYPNGFYRIQPLYPYGPFSSYPTPNSAVGAPVPSEWMLKFQYPHPLLRYEGYAPLTGMRSEIDQLESMNRSRWYSMKRSINPSGVLNMDEIEGLVGGLPPEEIDRIHEEWEKYQGSENAGKLIVGFPGSKLEQFGTVPKDMDYPQGWEQMMSFILGGGFGITKPAAGMIEDASYSNLYASLKQLHLLTLQPDCVDGSTPLLTREGAGPISDFVGKVVEVWNGSRWSPVTVQKTGRDRELLRVRFSDGSFLDCTPRHKFSVNTRADRDCWREVMAKDLVAGMATEAFAIQHTGGNRLEDTYTLGVLFGDGRTRFGRSFVDLYGDKIRLPIVGEFVEQGCLPSRVPHVFVKCGERFAERMDRLRADNEDSWWDMFSLDRQSILGFLAGWFDTDGSKGGPTSIYLSVSGRFRASMAQLLLTKCGIRSSIYRAAKAGDKTNYGRRGVDMWNVYVANCYDIPCHRLDTTNGKPPPCRGKYQTIRSIEIMPGLHDTYCFTEHEFHKGVFNNTLTHQCDDIASDITHHLAPFFGDNLIVEIRCRRIDDHDILFQKINILCQNKAITINQLLKLLEMPMTEEEWGQQRVGEEPQQQGVPGMEGAGLPGQAPPGQEQLSPENADPAQLQEQGEGLLAELGGGQQQEEDEIEGGRPTPGNLSRGSLGPRMKKLPKREKVLRPKVKSFYAQTMEVLGNGHAG